MKVQIQKWSNSLALRVLKSFAVESKIGRGATVEVSLEQGKIIVTPLTQPEFSLDELLAKVTKRNLHQEIEMGPPVGKEAW